MAEIKITVSEEDFVRLTEDSMEWGERWAVQLDRFESLHQHTDEPPSLKWKYVYWMGRDFTSTILARAFLEARGEACEVFFDIVPNPDPGYVILTDYEAWYRR